ncbi:serine hydrolase domain-containing protein [Actinomadura harenae]|uniref:Class A beta-lactamase-related serine hydrolase n=1 Tax=Actinomadura harenae TaxID=2483351 RepID=A0A3M2MDK0_9ACTN|nr:serine hydrolase domain-containing protein [Actinomadura harenae]RMI46963.1 class A beta-lactamase-related serine hydrolase [Actinomadura harenae]
MRNIPLAGAAAALTVLAAQGRATARPGAPCQVPPLDPVALEAAVAGPPDSEVTGAILKVTGPAGNWQGVSGAGDLAANAPPALAGRFRIGAVTRLFTAAVVLRLAARGLVVLDEPVQRYLPGVLPGAYPEITVRRLLDHTSGLPDPGAPGDGDAAWFVAHRLDSWTMRELVANAVRGPMAAGPGTVQRENPLGYWLAGMLIEQVTGHAYTIEATRRILRPLRLAATVAPGRHDPDLPVPHATAHLAVREDGRTVLHDVTRQSPWRAADGGLISNAPDLTRFVMALFRGRVVPPPHLDEMFRVPDVPDVPMGGGPRFGLGLMRITGANGVVAWGHTGSLPGYATGLLATRDLSRVVVYALNSPSADSAEHATGIIAATFGG